MRCIALGQAWLDAARHKGEVREQGSEVGTLKRSDCKSQAASLTPAPSVVFICAEIPGALAERLETEGFKLIRIDAEPGSPDDLTQTLNVVSLQSAIENRQSKITNPWLVLDGYHFDLDYQRGLRTAGCKLLLIDDYNHLLEYECDILLNQNIGAEELEYRINSGAKQLLGTKYVLLRREFRCLEKKDPVFPNLGKNVLVTLGGADPDNMTLKVIEALQQLDYLDLHVKIVVGLANPNLDSLQRATDLSILDFQLLTDVEDMPSLMTWADVTLSSGGSTCWELCCLGVPFVTLVLAENQRGLATELDRCGVAPCLGEDTSVDAIAGVLTGLLSDRGGRERCRASGRELVDGFGVYRVLYRPAKESGLDLLGGRFSLRLAIKCDMELFWNWANDPSVRENCYNSTSISLESHKKWFARKLASKDVLMLVFELDGTPVGQIRYDRNGEVAEIGFSIDRQFRGLGLGLKIIEQSFARAFSELGVDAVRAEVFQSNPASQSAFYKTGFELAESCEIKGVPSHIFIKKRS